MKKRTIVIMVAVLGLLIGGTVWAMRKDPVQEIRDMRKAMQDASPEDRRELGEQFREKLDQLTPEQRSQLWQDGQQERERRGDAEMAAYFALPPQDRTAYLDQQIQEMEKRRAEREAKRAQSDQSQDRGQRGQSGQAGAQPGQGQNANGGGRNRTSDARMQRRNQRLDSTTPEHRAQQTAYRAAMQQRRIELGLPANPPRRGR